MRDLLQLQSSAQPGKGSSFSICMYRCVLPWIFCVVAILTQSQFLSVATASPITQSTVGTVSTPRNEHYTLSPTMVSISKDVAYAFFVTSGGSCGWAKTTNGGASWGSINTDLIATGATDCFRVAVWYDRWTPGDTTGNYIHIVTAYASSNDIYYTRLDTTNDSKASTGWNAAFDITATNQFVSITKLTGGTLLTSLQGSTQNSAACSSNCTSYGNWTGYNNPQTSGAAGPVQLMALASNQVFFLHYNQGTGDLKYREGTWSSGNVTWNGTNSALIDPAAGVGGTSSNYKGNAAAVYNPDEGRVYIIYRNGSGTTADAIDTIRYTVSTDVLEWRTSAMSGTTYGVHDMALAYEADSQSLIVTYAARTASGASTAQLFMTTSIDGGGTWSSTSSVSISQGDHAGLSSNYYIPATTPGANRAFAVWVNEDSGVASSFSKTRELRQDDWRFFADTGGTNVTTALAGENVTPVDPASPMRLRMVVQNPNYSLSIRGTPNGESFKLQYGTGNCYTTSWQDVTNSTPVAFYNSAATDGAALTENTSLDPKYGSVDNRPLTYVESNPFSNSVSADGSTAIAESQSLLFDFNLTDLSLTKGVTTCLRIAFSDGTALYYPSAYPTIRKTGVVSSVYAYAGNGSYNAGDYVTLVVKFSTAANIFGSNPVPSLTLSNGATAYWAGYNTNDTSEQYFLYLVQAGDNSADLDYSGTSALAKNGYFITDSTANAYNLTLPAPGAAGSLGANNNVVIDTTTPAAPSITSPTNGASTNDTTPTISGTSEANASIVVYRAGSTQVCTTTANGSGTWSCDANPALTAATYSLTAKATDAAGNESAASTAVSLTIDTTAPSAPTISSPTNGATTGTTPTFSGTAEANGTVTVYRAGSTVVCSGTADGSGNWTCNASPALAGGSHSITAKVADAAGNVSVASSAISITVDATAPNVSGVSSSTTNGSYNAGDVIAVTVAFTENVTVTGTPQITLNVASGYAVNYSSGSGTSTLTFTYTIQSGHTSSDLDYVNTSSLALNGGTIKDAVGNNATLTLASPGAANSLGANKNLVIDTTTPAAPSITSPTSGSFTSDTTPTISGTSEANASVVVYRGGSTQVCATTANGSGNWSCDASPALAAASYALTAKATDAAENTSAASSTVTLTVDTTAPSAPSITSPTDGTVTSDGAPDISGTAEANSAITVYRGGSTELCTTTANGSGNWSCYAAPALGDGSYSVTAKATDAAGNTSDASSAISLTVTGSSSVSVTNVTSSTANGTYKVGDSITITVTFSNTVTVNTSGGTPSLSLNSGGAASAAYVSGSGSTTLTFDYAIGAGEGSADLDYDSGSALLLNGGTIVDGLALNVPPSLPTPGAAGSLGANKQIVVDTTAPAAPVITGPTDGTITNDNTPGFSGTAEANSTVEIFRAGSVSLGTTTADGSGNWSFTPSSALSDGGHSITAKATDGIGNISVASAALGITIDTAAPSAPSITSPTTGATTGDNTPTFSGTAEANSTVEIFRAGSTSLGTTTANGSGNWSFNVSSSLSDGSHSLTAKATDTANNTSTASTAVLLTVDTAAPAAPAITVPADSAITNDNTPTFSGTAEANATVTVYRGGATTVCSGSANGSGAWSCTPSSSLSDAVYSITAKAVDAGGNESAASSAISITIDTAAPAAPAITAPTSGTTTNDLTPAFVGTAEANATIEMFDGSTSLGTITADGSGAWSFTPTANLTEGAHSFKARATDAATNVSSDSIVVTVTLDSTVPAAPSITAPANNTVTNDSTPTFSGTAEANVTVSIYDNGGLLGTATATGGGTWTFTPSSTIGEGIHTITATATDASANTSGSSAAITITVDTIAPAVPVIINPISGSQLNDSSPTVSGTAEASSTVHVLLDGTERGTTTAQIDGSWSFDVPTVLTDGAHAVSAFATDQVNTGATSAVTNFTVALQYTISGHVKLKNANRDPLAGVQITDGTRTTTTDFDGTYVLSNVPAGTYTLVASMEGYTIEANVGTNPAQLTSDGLTDKDFAAKPKLKNPIYVPWNGLIDMTNIMELINTGNSSLIAVVTLYDLYGLQIGTPSEMEIPAGKQFDIILNNLDGFAKDNYGLAKVEFSSNNFDGRLTYYRRAKNGVDFEFGFPVPFMNPIRGNSYVAFNTYQPSLARSEAKNPVLQWLTVVNVDPDSSHEYTINRYNMSGQVIWTNTITLGPMGRYDMEGGHETPGRNNVGLNEIVPADATAPYLVQLVRYGVSAATGKESADFNFAVALTGQTGIGSARYVPIENSPDADNYVEIVNVSDYPISVIVAAYTSAGELADDTVLTLPAKGQEHVYANAYLPRGGSGFLTLAPSQTDSLITQSMKYFRKAQTGQLLSASGFQGGTPYGKQAFGSYNSFLGMKNWLRLINVSDNPVDVTINVSRLGTSNAQAVEVIQPHARVDLNLNQSTTLAVSAEGYGTVAVQSTVEGAVLAEVVRVRNKTTGEIDFIASTPIR